MHSYARFTSSKANTEGFKEIHDLSEVTQLLTCGVRIQTQMSGSEAYAFLTIVISLKDLGEQKLEE